MKKVGVAILGLGTVGGGTYRILTEKREMFRQVQKLDVSVEAVLEINRAKAEALGVPEGVLTASLDDVLNNPAVDIVVEVIGGVEPARTFILSALKRGKTVVTANKELISKYWYEIEAVAKEHRAGFYFEASCVGGVPIIRTLIDGMQANRIESMMGIINGTTNFILSKMANEGLDYGSVLRQAQESGFAEADPTSDVKGFDAAYKLSILSSLAFSAKVPLEEVYREGISGIDIKDINLGKELGYTLKLLGIGKNTEKGIECRVHPAFIPKSNPLASVDGSFNAVLLHGDSVDDIMLYGRGAGALPTGSAIVSDILYAAKQQEHYYTPFPNTQKADPATRFVTDFETRYYLRLTVADAVGVLSSISGVLGRHNVSVLVVEQRGEAKNGAAEIIFITHKTFENSIQAAIAELKKSDLVYAVNTLIRVED